METGNQSHIFIYSFWILATKFFNHVGLHVFPFPHIISKEETQTFNADVGDRVVSLIEMLDNRFVPMVLNTRYVFIKTCINVYSRGPLT